jgi:hypothetical protein
MDKQTTTMEAKTHTVSREMVPGIVRDAHRLGVSRFHLWAVLRGRRQSPRLVQRYERLRERKAV